MLIFDSKKGRFGTQKPKQWGALSAVRSAVFRNAESMGIDPKYIKLYMPLWEEAGTPVNIISSERGSLESDAIWSNTGVNTVTDLDTINSGLTIKDVLKLGGTSGGSISFRYKYVSGAPDFNYFMSSDGAEYYLIYNTSDYTGDLTLKLNRSDYLHGSVTDLFDGKWHSVAFSLSYNDVWTIFYDGKILVTAPAPTNAYISADADTALYFGGRPDAPLKFAAGTMCEILGTPEVLIIDQIAQLHETPYILLQPNPTPLIFDWGTASTVPTLSAPSFVGRIPSTTLAF
jgi:hypothetical protein